MLLILSLHRDQLYFERIHPVAPIVHIQRYLMWAEDKEPSAPRACLRMAMRTVASTVAPRLRDLGDSLYVETDRMLQSLNASGNEDHQDLPWMTMNKSATRIPLEKVQALLLLVHFHVMRGDRNAAFGTAAQALRLARLLRLHDSDADTSVSYSSAREAFAQREEKRRTFWLTFSFDRLFSGSEQWKMTLHEEIVRFLLPLTISLCKTDLD